MINYCSHYILIKLLGGTHFRLGAAGIGTRTLALFWSHAVEVVILLGVCLDQESLLRETSA